MSPAHILIYRKKLPRQPPFHTGKCVLPRQFAAVQNQADLQSTQMCDHIADASSHHIFTQDLVDGPKIR